MKTIKGTNRKTIQLLLMALISTITSFGQELRVSGSTLQDALGNNIILRGVNYPIIDDYNVHTDDFAAVEAKIDQVALSGANCIRFQWYTNGVHYKDQMNPSTDPGYGPGTLDGYVNDGSLSHMLTYTRTKGMISVLEIHDLTGGNDNAVFQSQIMGFWTDPDVLSLIEENKGHLIINLANEYGLVRFTGNQTAASNAFRDNYISSIAALRNLNVNVPIMIDAPDYGQSSTELLTVAGAILSSDSQQNVIFSTHAYWYAYANNQSTVQTKLNEMQNSGFCCVLGEVANSQADAPDYCGELDLSALYPIILSEACSREIGWLGWSWDQDCDPDREMTSNGNVANATPYGTDLMTNANYGLLSAGGCGAAELAALDAGVDELNNQLKVWPNPVVEDLRINDSFDSFEIRNSLGELVLQGDSIGQNINCSSLEKGVYILRIKTEATIQTVKFIK